MSGHHGKPERPGPLGIGLRQIGAREQTLFRSFLRLLELVSAHDLHPQIDRVFEFEDTRAAFEYAASGQQFGKVVISQA